jgi:hypothetical protein
VLPESSKLALNLGLAAGLECIEWLSFNDTDRLVITPTGWTAPVGQIKVNGSLGFIKDPNYVGGFYPEENPQLTAVTARLGLGANPPKVVITPPLFV